MVARVDARVGALGLQITSVETGGRTDGGEDREGCYRENDHAVMGVHKSNWFRMPRDGLS